jgi:D-alanyl-lipoteichoic acid acyltransferase DltB (MBOAT superfamily)
MRLDSSAFLTVFAAFFLVYAAVPPLLKRVLLVLGSVAFYATLNLRHVPLLLALGLFTFVVASRIERETSEPRRNRLLWIGVGANVLALAFFKGAALGISFFTLQGISYVVDVHRRAYRPPRSLLSFLASFTLFPHLLSGPIVRASFLVPLIEEVDMVSWATARRALLLFTVGFLKKAIADRLAAPADLAFDASRPLSTLEAWTGLLAYAGQLYGDFSGYTDMATALALLLGLDLPPNFNLPYLATSPADFWRRWHISLSTWLRDYVYLPLGVKFRRRRYVNLIVTWIAAGLWHGVRWPFVLYGLYHGVLLVITDWLSRRFESDDELRGGRRLAQMALTFYLVLMGYVLFRAHSLSVAARYLAALHSSRAPSVFSHDAITTLGACLGALVGCHLLDHAVKRWRTVVERPWILWPAMALAVTMLALFQGAAQPFIYFAF